MEEEIPVFLKQMDTELDERRRDFTICIICDSKDISIVDLGIGPMALCGTCSKMLHDDIEWNKIAKLGEKLKYVMGDVIRRKRIKRVHVSYQRGIVEHIERICKRLGIGTQREFRVDTGRVDLILKTPQSTFAIEVERQYRITKDKTKITAIGKGAIIFDTYKDKIDDEFIKQLVASDPGIRVFA